LRTSHTRQNPKSTENEVRLFLERAGLHGRYEKCVPALGTYFRELLLWSRRINLTGIKSIEKMVAKHLGDTLVLEQWLPKHVHSVLDIGTGAGIPGLILKILRPGLEVWLLDARRKRISFLHSVIAELGIAGVYAVHGRAGTGSGLDTPGAPDSFDMVTSQAVGSIVTLTDMAAQFLKPDGIAVSMKGPGGEAELDQSRHELHNKRWQARAVAAETPVEKQRRFLIVLEKMKEQ